MKSSIVAAWIRTMFTGSAVTAGRISPPAARLAPGRREPAQRTDDDAADRLLDWLSGFAWFGC